MKEREPTEEELNQIALDVLVAQAFVATSGMPYDSQLMKDHLKQIEVGMEILKPYLDNV